MNSKKHRKIFLLLLMITYFLVGCTGRNLNDQNTVAIRQTSLDYMEGWYEGNAERMGRALHPNLVKRRSEERSDGSFFHQSSWQDMVNSTQRGGGKMFPIADRQIKVTILDVNNSIASVKVESREYYDYLHLGKFDDKWLIINVLWDFKRK
ncbi:MAG: nuclear transport factor 2 family protein [Bacteroidales bacterium]|jgi:hypothetical protein|nr:nuclear transport factor 2 family protein [Bacteroidales bacterium]